MLPRLKSFHKPKTINEVLKLLARPGIRTLPLYGGPELFDNLAAAAEMEEVVSLAGLNLDRVTDEDGWLRLGAMTPLAALPDGDLVTAAARAYPLNLRQMWTVGAVVAHGGASSPFLVTLLALGARVEVAGQEEQDLSEYLPRRAATDLVAAVIVPSNPDCGGVAFEAVARTPSDEPIVCAAACAKVDEGRIVAATLALGGVAKVPMLANDVARALLATPATRESIEAALRTLDDPPLQPPADFRGSSEYRRAMAKVTARRALLRAMNLSS